MCYASRITHVLRITHHAARSKPLGVRLSQDESGYISASPLVGSDSIDGSACTSPAAAAAAAAAVAAGLTQPVPSPVQPWERTASCLSLLAAASEHYPQLVRCEQGSVMMMMMVMVTVMMMMMMMIMIMMMNLFVRVMWYRCWSICLRL